MKELRRGCKYHGPKAHFVHIHLCYSGKDDIEYAFRCVQCEEALKNPNSNGLVYEHRYKIPTSGLNEYEDGT